MGIITSHVPRQGWRSIIRVCLGETKPSTTIATVSITTAAARLATSLAVSGITQQIDKGNWLLFRTANGKEVVVKLTETALSGATSLTITPAESAIALAAAAQFPPEIFDRSSADYTASAATSDISTLNTGGFKQTVTTEISASIAAPGFLHHSNPGLKICHDAFSTQETVWAMLEYEAPTADYSRGRIILGKAVLADASISSAAADFVTADVELSISGSVEDTPPTLAP